MVFTVVQLQPLKSRKYLFHVPLTKRKSVLARERIFVLYSSLFTIYNRIFVMKNE